jgi:hypothetical protein
MTQSGEPSSTSWGLRAIVTVVVLSAIGALVGRYTNLLAAHVETNFGYVANPEATRAFLKSLARPTFRDAAPEIMERAKPVDVFLYRNCDKASRAAYGKPFTPWNQGNAGTCVSFGWGLGAYASISTDWVTGKIREVPKLVDTSSIYGGSRTEGRQPPVKFAGWSDGSYGGAAARWVSGLKNGHGGILFCQPYGDVDLTNYSIDRSRKWGAYGVPADLAVEANKHKATAIALVTDWESLTQALRNGYAVPICSNVGFAATNVRDADGFLPRGGSWSHCMVVLAIRHAANSGVGDSPVMAKPRDGALIVNSWGSTWVRGPKSPADQPDGSFWASRADIEAILRQEDSFAIGGVDGFQYRPLDHKAWMDHDDARPVVTGVNSLAF